MHRWIPYGALASLCLLGTAPLAFGKPNIIFLLADDQRHDVLGCAGNALIQTPTIDRLDRYLAAYPKAPGTSAE